MVNDTFTVKKMDLEPTYTFVSLPKKNFEATNDKESGEFFNKWYLVINVPKIFVIFI